MITDKEIEIYRKVQAHLDNLAKEHLKNNPEEDDCRMTISGKKNTSVLVVVLTTHGYDGDHEETLKYDYAEFVKDILPAETKVRLERERKFAQEKAKAAEKKKEARLTLYKELKKEFE